LLFSNFCNLDYQGICEKIVYLTDARSDRGFSSSGTGAGKKVTAGIDPEMKAEWAFLNKLINGIEIYVFQGSC
jgi:hypothetical protein